MPNFVSTSLYYLLSFFHEAYLGFTFRWVCKISLFHVARHDLSFMVMFLVACWDLAILWSRWCPAVVVWLNADTSFVCFSFRLGISLATLFSVSRLSGWFLRAYSRRANWWLGVGSGVYWDGSSMNGWMHGFCQRLHGVKLSDPWVERWVKVLRLGGYCDMKSCPISPSSSASCDIECICDLLMRVVV